MVGFMTIVARGGLVIAERRRRPHGFDRVLPVTRRNDMERELAGIALDVVVSALDVASLPPRWSTRAFAREVAAIRAQLAPIGSRRSLVDSFGREAAVAATATPPAIDPGVPPGPVRVAYAIRWLELGDQRPRPSWDVWTGQPLGGRPLCVGRDQRNGEITT
jgi:hypothetical protein